MNFVSQCILLRSTLLLWWVCVLSSGVSQVLNASEPDLSSGTTRTLRLSQVFKDEFLQLLFYEAYTYNNFCDGVGTVDPLQPWRLQETNLPLRRHLSQSSRSEDDEDDLSCNLTSSQRGQFYNASSHEWLVTDEVLEELDNDLQSIVACTATDDFIFFSTERRIKPSRSTIIPRRLTLSAQPRGSLFRNGMISETWRKVRLTCPDRGDLITVRSRSITIANMIFTGCNRTGNVVVIDPQCNDRSAGGVIQFVHTEFRNDIVSDNQRLLETVDPSCTNIVMENVVIRENQCESGCMVLSQNNTLRDIRVNDNQVMNNINSSIDRSVFIMSVDSETIAANISASRNEIRLFSILNSRFTLRESNLSGNTMNMLDSYSTESIGGSVLLSNSSTVVISDSVLVNNSGWNGGAVYSSASEFNLSNCTFHGNNADIGNGGAFYTINGAFFTLLRCTFSNNNATLGAGVFSYQNASVHVMDTRFLDNNGTSGAGLYIVNGDMTIESCAFCRNYASFGGGAFATLEVDTSILNSTFVNNNATWGGACMFLNDSSVRMAGVKFAHNHAFEGGEAGAIYANYTTLDFRNVTFNRNSAVNYVAAVHIGYGYASFVDVNVTNNYAEDLGTIYIINSSASFDGVLFQRNNLSRRGSGAGFYSDNSNITVTRSLFLENYADFGGGGIGTTFGTRLEISDTLFHNNTAIHNGGAINVGYSTLLIRDANFTNNTVDHEGGGCHFLAVNATLRNLIFHGNRANLRGGGIYVLHSEVIGQDLFFEYNHAGVEGGGLSISGSQVIGQGLQFEYNHAEVDGGGCYADYNSSLSFTRFQFINNTAEYGGGMYAYEATLNIAGPCIFRRNYGGALSTKFYANASVASCVFDSNAAEYGASFWTAEYTRSRIVNCTFVNSTANGQGGCIRMYNNTRMSIKNSSFTRCKSGSEGGGIAVVIESILTIRSCRFLRNRATKGAGVYVTNGHLNLDESDFNLGQSTESGGGICSTNRSVVTIQNSSFRRNVVEDGYGGGIYGDNSSFINLTKSELTHNSANHGAGLYTSDMESVNCNSVNFIENNASQSGGGARVAVAYRVQSFHNCRFVRNTAEEGGCLVGVGAELRMINTLCEGSVATIRAGGLFFDNCTVTVSDTRVMSSQAHNFGGILATNSSQIIARNLSSSTNIAVEDGGGIGIVNGSSLLCSRCKFEHNMATRGAGLFIVADDSLPLAAQLQDSPVLNNSALTLGGGMLFISPLNLSINCNAPGTTCSRVALLNVDFQNNSAGQSGAAVLTTDPEGVVISCTQQRLRSTLLEQDQIGSLEVLDPKGLCSSWRGNQVPRNAPGDTIGTFGLVLSFSVDPNEEIQIIGDAQSGFVLENVASGVQLPVIFVTVLDAYGNGPLTTNPEPLDITMVSPDGFFQGTITANIVNGSGNFSNIIGFRPPGNYTLRVFPNAVSSYSAELVVHVRHCEVGEEPTENRELCQKCDAVSFNFSPQRPGGCTPCPSDATCESRFIVPKDGYWHKSPCHANVKECLTDEACSYEKRQDQLRNYTGNIHDCVFNETALMEYNEVACREGYEGPLCGSCAGEYGLSLGFKCSKCPNDFESIITLLLFTLYLLAISSFTIRGGLPSRSRDSKVAVRSTSALAHDVVTEEQHQEAEVNFEKVETMRDGCVRSEYFQEPLTQNNESTIDQQSQEQQPSNEVELTRWVTTEIFKVLINYLQVTAVAATINVRWTEGVLVMFEASEYMGALTTAALSRPIDCLASSNSAAVRSIWRTLLSLFVPGAVMVIFASFWGIIAFLQNKGLSFLWKRITLSTVAVIYISYLGLTKLAVRVFYCVDVYDSDDIFSNSQNKVWAVDTYIQCYKREHISLIVIAVFVLIMISFSFPLISAVILSQNKGKQRDTNSWTMDTMGFLYRAFKEDYVFWESLIMLRKACLSIIVVFSYPLGGQTQGLLALVVLVFAHHLHFICLPYRQEFHKLNLYESGSLLAASMTFVLGQFFNVERSSDSTRVFVAVIVIVMNSLFFAFLLFVLFRSGIAHLTALLRSEDHSIHNNACWWVVLMVYVKSRTNKWTRARN